MGLKPQEILPPRLPFWRVSHAEPQPAGQETCPGRQPPSFGCAPHAPPAPIHLRRREAVLNLGTMGSAWKPEGTEEKWTTTRIAAAPRLARAPQARPNAL